MTTDSEILQKRKTNPVAEGLYSTGLYHSIRLPNGEVLPGAMTLQYLEERLSCFGLPKDLNGKRLLDIGPWDGFFTFEMERRGASVTAIDYVDLDTFRALHRAFHSRAEYLRMDLYELDPAALGHFDIVLCLGVLYHLKHPLLGLEKVCAVTKEVCIIDTYVVDGERYRNGDHGVIPYIEFYERDELAGQLDNWSGPTVMATQALARAAGFALTEVRRVTETTAIVAAFRCWQNLPACAAPPIILEGLTCHVHRGRSFSSKQEQYMQLWCKWNSAAAPLLEKIYPEVDGYGAPPMSATIAGNSLLVNIRIPPGLAPGVHTARIKVDDSAWSQPSEFYVDLPQATVPLRILSVQDGLTWESGVVNWTSDGWMTVWIEGLSPEADPGNTVVEISNIPHAPEAVLQQRGQINLRLRPVISPGRHSVRVLHRGLAAGPEPFLVQGTPPPIRGLEKLPRA